MALKSGRVGIHPSQVDPITGMLLSSPGGASDLSDLNDVSIDNPEIGQLLVYDGDKWENQFASISPVTPSTLASLQDVNIDNAEVGQLLVYDGNKWENQFASISPVTPATLQSLQDVLISSPASGQTLEYDGDENKWVNVFASISPMTLSQLQDVVITDLQDNDYLMYDSTEGKWINSGSAPGPVVPEGSTVTPTDDIQTWLACAGITDKTYTTLAEVLNDSTTLLALLSSNNASDYLVRSKSWGGEGLVPTMTDDTHPSGVCSAQTPLASSTSAYCAFDGSDDTYYMPVENSDRNGFFIRYQFPSAKVVTKMYVKGYVESAAGANYVFQLQGSNDGSTWTSISGATLTFTYQTATDTSATFSNTTAYTDYQIIATSGPQYSHRQGQYGIHLRTVQFYDDNLCDNSTAMTDIGANNYCANTLLDDATWCTAICNSTYFESVLNVKVPTMTSDNTPSGVCISSSTHESYQAYKAFDGNNSTMWGKSSSDANPHIGYEFTSPVVITKVYIKNATYGNDSESVKLCAYSDGAWVDVSSTVSISKGSGVENTFTVANSTAYSKNALFSLDRGSGLFWNVAELQFYGRKDI